MATITAVLQCVRLLCIFSFLQVMCSRVLSQNADRRVAYGLLLASPGQGMPVMQYPQYYASPVDGGYGGAGYGGAGGYGGYPAMGWGSPYAGYATGPAPAPQQPQQQSLASLMNPLFGGNGGSYSPLISSLLGR